MRYKLLNIICPFITVLVCMLALGGCSGAIARGTAQDPHVIQKGAHRFDIEKRLGRPDKIERLPTGEILVSYSIDPGGKKPRRGKRCC